jgi:hypothetical protein
VYRSDWRKERATNGMNLSQLRRAFWLRRLSDASQSRFTLLKNHHRLGWLSDKLDGLADQVREPGGKAGMFERFDRFRQGFAVRQCHV